MPRAKADTQETARLRAFCIVVTRHVGARMQPPLSAAIQQSLDAIAVAPKKYLPISDLLEWTAELSASEIDSLDAQLRAADAPTIGDMRMEYWAKRIPAILRRGRVRSDDEFYLLKEAADGSGCGLSESDIALARELVDQYEVRASGRNA